MDTVIHLENVSVIHSILEISVIVLSVVRVAMNIMDTARNPTPVTVLLVGRDLTVLNVLYILDVNMVHVIFRGLVTVTRGSQDITVMKPLSMSDEDED